MANNKRVSQETFGTDPSSPRITGGSMPIFGHMIKDGTPIPDRGTSVNTKTGYPAKGSK